MYNYQTERKHVFTEDGQVMFLALRDKTVALCQQAGAARMDKIMSGVTGDTWHMLACVDRMVELGELREITGPCPGQRRVFILTKED